MPFPPKAKEKSFDYETLVRDNVSSNRLLWPEQY